MVFVARDLLDPHYGAPKVRGDQLRYRRRGSLSVDTARGVWHDHEAAVGGGVIDLVQYHLGVGRYEALTWLRNRGYLPRGRGSSPLPAPSSRSGRSPASAGRDEAQARVALTQRLWCSGVESARTPACAYLESRGVWVPGGYSWVRWLAREASPATVPEARWWGLPRGACGALVCAYVRDRVVSAVSLEALDSDGRTLRERWRRTFGHRSGAAFRVRDGGDVLHVAEGEIDALAVARSTTGAVYGAGGTSGVACCIALVDQHREVVIHADGDPAGRRAATRGLASVRARGLRARVFWYRDDPAAEVLR